MNPLLQQPSRQFLQIPGALFDFFVFQVNFTLSPENEKGRQIAILPQRAGNTFQKGSSNPVSYAKTRYVIYGLTKNRIHKLV